MKNQQRPDAQLLITKEGKANLIKDIAAKDKEILEYTQLQGKELSDVTQEKDFTDSVILDVRAQIARLANQKASLIYFYNNAKVIDSVKKDVVNMDDYVNLKVVCLNTKEIEFVSYKITGNACPDVFADVPEISINCPLGQAIYLKEVGSINEYQTSYKLTWKAQILSIIPQLSKTK